MSAAAPSKTSNGPARLRSRGGGRLVLTSAEGDVSRAFVLRMLMLFGRVDQLRRRLYLSDLDLASVGETVGASALEPFWRDSDASRDFQSFREIVGVERQRGVNALSIAQSTGMPRETVRRMLKKLVKHGILAEKTRGRYVYMPGFVQKSETQEMAAVAIRETMMMMNDLVELGIIRWVAEPPSNPKA
jgi:predicted transcriptional regulator